jgi:hypothetical protein
MHLIIKFKNNGFLYYYFLFLFIIGSCTYSSSGGESSKEGDLEEIDEIPDKKRDDDKITDQKIDVSDEDYDLTDVFDLSDDDIVYLDSDSEFYDDDLLLPDISGSWVKLMIFKGIAKPFLISTCNAWAIMVLKVDFKQEGENIISQNEMCRLKAGNDTKPTIQSLIPDSYAKSLSIVEKNATISVDENGDILFYQPKIWEVRACDLNDPENDPLPTDENAHNVFDPDLTGINGLKVEAKGAVNGWGEIVQKVSTILNGRVLENGEIHGTVIWYEDQKVLKTNNVLMQNGAPTSNDPNGDPNESLFIYKRVDPSWDCDMIKEKSAELFPEQAFLYPKEFE